MDNEVIVSTPKGQRYVIPEVTTCPPAPKKLEASKKQRSSTVNVLAKKFEEEAGNEDDDTSIATQKDKGIVHMKF
ncbi:hypothetical protein TorRG33x02_300250 [Trema orientale]|uniref:Uncharacterized protein n=1 Tax=Trema orientale TaxID=63057 RepID=A0A2P5C2C3_TREOI|nr:hypothetical protein TorRG33x02_300250 [Trema orientale]